MKKLVSLCFVALFAGSCSKNLIEVPQISKAYLPLTQTVEQVLSNATSLEDRKMRETKLIFGKALSEVFKEHKFVDLVLNNAQRSVLKEANLNTLISENGDFKTALNQALLKQLPKENSRTTDDEDDIFSLLAAQLATPDNYIPKIVVPNLSTLDATKSAIVSAGLELNEDIDTTLNDHIWAMFPNEQNGEYTDIAINESDAHEATNPVLIFANGVEESQFEGGEVFGEGLNEEFSIGEIGGGKTETLEQFDFTTVSVKQSNYFYESSGKNEYQYIGIYFTNAETWGWLFPNQNLSTRIARFKENQCNGTDFSVSNDDKEFYHAAWHSPQPTSDLIVFMNTYERDWYASLKPLGNFTLKGETAYLTGKMVQTWQWYASANGVLFTGGVVPIGGISVKENEKTKIQVLRVN